MGRGMRKTGTDEVIGFQAEPIELGVCTDVVVRALGSSPGLDLQQLVHEDMGGDFSAYQKARSALTAWLTELAESCRCSIRYNRKSLSWSSLSWSGAA